MLGSLLRPHLESLGVTVIGIDKKIPTSQGAPHLKPPFKIQTPLKVDRVCDFADAKSCQHIFEDCTHVIHLAAQGDPDADMMTDIMPNNILGTINATNAAKDAGTVSRFVFASTNHIYHANTMGSDGPGSYSVKRADKVGGAGATKVTHPFAPDSAYAVSKVFGENLGFYLARVERDFEFVALRIGWCAYDTPTALEKTIHDDYLKAMFLSKQDWVGFATAALSVDLSPHDGFLAAFAVSQNETCPFDMNESRKLLQYQPVVES
jgi:nucleoside-diphosphate-sugar epimerase